MSLSFQVPQSARYIPTVNVFAAPFNDPSAPGQFNFAAAPQNVVALSPLQPNTVYLIERIAVGGDIASEDYFAAQFTVPQLFIRKRAGNAAIPENVYTTPLPLVGFSDSQECAAFVTSDKGGDALLLGISGILNMTPALLGRGAVQLHIRLDIFAIDERTYNTLFKSRTTVGPVAGARG